MTTPTRLSTRRAPRPPIRTETERRWELRHLAPGVYQRDEWPLVPDRPIWR
jgi:hypothetical protein